jgi:hypothetical protein
MLVGDKPRGFQSTFVYHRKMRFECGAIHLVDVGIRALKPTEIESSLRDDIVK